MANTNGATNGDTTGSGESGGSLAGGIQKGLAEAGFRSWPPADRIIDFLKDDAEFRA